jgi:hypothetical protein
MPLLALLLLTLAGCGQDLHFKISYNDVRGLQPGDPVVLDNQPVGKVIGLEPGQAGENLVEVGIPRESATAATSEASFVLAPNPGQPGRSRIEIVLARPGGKPIADGAVVQGSYPNPLGLSPFSDLLRGFGDVMRDLRGQVEQFRQEFQKLPDSPEGKRLQEEWRRLTDEIGKAQSEAGSTMNKEILPKLEKEMDELRKRMEALPKSEPAQKPAGKALQI